MNAETNQASKEWWSSFSCRVVLWFIQVLASVASPKQALSAETLFSRQNATSTGFDRSWPVLRYDCTSSQLHHHFSIDRRKGIRLHKSLPVLVIPCVPLLSVFALLQEADGKGLYHSCSPALWCSAGCDKCTAGDWRVKGGTGQGIVPAAPCLVWQSVHYFTRWPQLLSAGFSPRVSALARLKANSLPGACSSRSSNRSSCCCINILCWLFILCNQPYIKPSAILLFERAALFLPETLCSINYFT